MFRKRCEKPRGTLIAGIAVLAIGVLFLPVALPNLTDTSARGFPIWLVEVVLLGGGAYYTTWGALWLKRDRG